MNAEAREKVVSKQETEQENAFVRRNMLMNIILRPGGGDRAKALPRPKVQVNSEGSNVILVKLTFPENENIQGLRAFTPTDSKDLEKFAELRNSIRGDASIEISSEESEESEFIDSVKKQQRAPKSKEQFSRPLNRLVSNPNRPPRPSKVQKASFNFLPPVGRPRQGPKSFTAFGKISRQPTEIINMLDKEIENEISEEFQFVQPGRIKPRQPQDKPPEIGEIEPFLAYETKKNKLIKNKEPISSEPEISNEIETSPKQQSPIRNSLKIIDRPRPTRPHRPVKKVNKSPQNQIKNIKKPAGPPPRPQGPPPQLPPQGVKLTRSGRRHPGLKVQARLDTKNHYSFPTLDKVWRGRRIL